MIRIILGGKMRGSTHNWITFNNFIKTDYKIYVASLDPSSWQSFSLPFEITKCNLLENTIFNEKYRHVHRERYLHQWSCLTNSFNHFKDKFDKNDIIVKLRNDFLIEDDSTLDWENIKDNCLYVPEKEFHYYKPFDTTIICNDQIVVGRFQAMEKYFSLPFNIFVLKGKHMSIERSLWKHIHLNELNFETFKLTYRKKLK